MKSWWKSRAPGSAANPADHSEAQNAALAVGTLKPIRKENLGFSESVTPKNRKKDQDATSTTNSVPSKDLAWFAEIGLGIPEILESTINSVVIDSWYGRYTFVHSESLAAGGYLVHDPYIAALISYQNFYSYYGNGNRKPETRRTVLSIIGRGYFGSPPFFVDVGFSRFSSQIQRKQFDVDLNRQPGDRWYSYSECERIDGYGISSDAGIDIRFKSTPHLGTRFELGPILSPWRSSLCGLLACAPGIVLTMIPWLVSQSSGRVFSHLMLARSMPEIYIILGLCSLIGGLGGVLRIVSLAAGTSRRRPTSTTASPFLKPSA